MAAAVRADMGNAASGSLAVGTEAVLGVSDFVAIFNQTLDYVYPEVMIVGELANLRVSKGRWLYFDLKDEISVVKFFGTVRHLPGPLEDGMLLSVRGTPRLHHQYGFSVNVLSIRPAGEGTIKRAAQLVQAKLQKEGLFDEMRKRPLPYPPARIGLITSTEAAAYADFVKVLEARWGGVGVELINVQVQGENAPEQLIAALERFNGLSDPPEVIVLVRGGGSAEDLAAFNNEAVTRAVAASRVPTLVAVGHETDISLAELAADRRASTPSNAAELLVPDRQNALANLKNMRSQLDRQFANLLTARQNDLEQKSGLLLDSLERRFRQARQTLHIKNELLAALNPEAILQRGYAIVRNHNGSAVVRSTRHLTTGDIVDIQLADGRFKASINNLNRQNGKTTN